jgi:hypothetical protein
LKKKGEKVESKNRARAGMRGEKRKEGDPRSGGFKSCSFELKTFIT